MIDFQFSNCGRWVNVVLQRTQPIRPDYFERGKKGIADNRI